ncbi:MAG TPA: hypothetical protein VHY20_02810, partial [Pirellulales bacterium]|nr:hypothetical protein [Pirellulales bacterium]
AIAGRPLIELCDGEWGQPALRSWLSEVIKWRGRIDRSSIELEGAQARRLRISIAARWVSEQTGAVRMLLALDERPQPERGRQP